MKKSCQLKNNTHIFLIFGGKEMFFTIICTEKSKNKKKTNYNKNRD